MTGTRKLGLRVLCVALCLVSLLSMALPVATAAEPQTETQTTTAIIRRTASGSGYPIGQMENGTKLNILGEKGSFYKIDCYDMTGYIAKSQVIHTDGEYYVNCQKGSDQTAVLNYVSREEALSLRNDVLTRAKSRLGDRYKYGGSRPGGFDCSGFTSYVCNYFGMGLHRTASTQLQDGVIIPREALQVGDLVFFREAGNSHPATHVGIYVGDNKMIHSARHGVCYEELSSPYYAKYYLCARRIINTSAVAPEQVPIARIQTAGLDITSITGRTAQCCN